MSTVSFLLSTLKAKVSVCWPACLPRAPPVSRRTRQPHRVSRLSKVVTRGDGKLFLKQKRRAADRPRGGQQGGRHSCRGSSEAPQPL